MRGSSAGKMGIWGAPHCTLVKAKVSFLQIVCRKTFRKTCLKDKTLNFDFNIDRHDSLSNSQTKAAIFQRKTNYTDTKF